MRYLLILTLLFLTACQSAHLPTSERLVGIKGMKLSALRNEMLTQNLELGQPAFIRVFKYENTLEAWVKSEDTKQYTLFKSYPICNFSGDLGPKIKEGDHQSPEGFYSVGADQMNPWSQYKLSFDLGFPNEYDTAQGRTGSALMIHGGCKSIGCYAMTDPVIEDLYLLTEASIATGQNVPVHIFPFRMNARNMAAHESNQWHPFWQNLKEGYDAFELTKTPPEVSTKNHQYTFKTQQKPATYF